MTDRPQVSLRVEPHQIPALRAAFFQAAARMSDELISLKREGWIHEPWLGDPVSATVKNIYDAHVMGRGPGQALGDLIAYRDELLRVHDTLAQMEAEYRRTEGDNAALWGRT